MVIFFLKQPFSFRETLWDIYRLSDTVSEIYFKSQGEQEKGDRWLGIIKWKLFNI